MTLKRGQREGWVERKRNPAKPFMTRCRVMQNAWRPYSSCQLWLNGHVEAQFWAAKIDINLRWVVLGFAGALPSLRAKKLRDG